VNLFRNRAGLFSAPLKSKNICIINKTNTIGREIRGVAKIKKISIVKGEKNGRVRRALGNALLRRERRRREARKSQAC
jgi:hypothetical protein